MQQGIVKMIQILWEEVFKKYEQVHLKRTLPADSDGKMQDENDK